jgi:hypothetical protein
MKPILWFLASALILTPLSARAGSGACFTLEHQSYCRAWSDKNASMMKTEFVRSNETVDHWQRMVTILRYNDTHTIQGAIARYMSVVKPYMAADATPQWITPKNATHAEQVATRLLLSTPDGSDSEYVVVYFFSDPGKPAYAVAFSQRLPLPSGKTPALAQYASWLKDMMAIVPSALNA